MQLIKGESSYWINKEQLLNRKFEWQDEYFAVSVSESMLDKVRNYIKNQEGFPPLMWVGRQWRVDRDAYDAWKLFCYSKTGKQ
jgi:hypothetical protein